MTVRLTSPVLGQAVGSNYTGKLETWLLSEGYATVAATVPNAWNKDDDGILGAKPPVVNLTPTAAVLVGSQNAVNLTASGNLAIGTRDGKTSVAALASGDTPAQAATKIDTALSGFADAAVVGGKLQITSTATGPGAYVAVVSGPAAILANLGLVAGVSVHGTAGLPPGHANTGPQADVPENDPTASGNRGDKPYWPDTPDTTWSIANDAENLNKDKFPAPKDFDFDPGGEDDDAPADVALDPAEGPAAGGTVVTVTGRNLVGVTAVNFGADPGTDLDVDEAADGVIKVTTPEGVAGPVDVTLVDADGNTVVDDGFTYTA